MEIRKRYRQSLVISRESEICGKKLPSQRQVLSNLLYEIEVNKKSIINSAYSAVSTVLEFWKETRIPTQKTDKCEQKAVKLFKRYATLRKTAYRDNKAQISHENQFSEDLEELFEIAHANALELIKIPEDRAFLLAQREKGRKGSMVGVDIKLAKQEARIAEQEQKKLNRAEKARKEAEMLAEKVVLDTSSALSSDEDVESKCKKKKKVEDSCTFGPGDENRAPQGKRGRKLLLTPDLAAALDRTSLSSRKAAFVLAETAKSLGENVSELVLNEKTIRKSREKFRKETAETIQNSFSPGVPLVVHWDGKLLEDITGKKVVDRLPILVSGYDVDELLNVPALPAGTGHAQADAVYQTIKDWGIADQVRGLCFDTTSTNTGIHKGACPYLEKFLNKPLLYCACRHHTSELFLGSAVTCCFGKTKQPEWPVFKKFRTEWNNIDKTKYKTAADDPAIWAFVEWDENDIVFFCRNQLKRQKQPRDDYKELLELTMIFLGETPKGGVHFKKPGAVSNARWMAKALYLLKIWMFHEQYALTEEEKKQFAYLCTFIFKINVKYWFEAPLTVANRIMI